MIDVQSYAEVSNGTTRDSLDFDQVAIVDSSEPWEGLSNKYLVNQIDGIDRGASQGPIPSLELQRGPDADRLADLDFVTRSTWTESVSPNQDLYEPNQHVAWKAAVAVQDHARRSRRSTGIMAPLRQKCDTSRLLRPNVSQSWS